MIKTDSMFMKKGVQFIGVTVLKIFDLLVKVFTKNVIIADINDFPEYKNIEPNWKIFLEDYRTYKGSKEIYQYAAFYKTGTDIGQYGNWKGGPLLLFDYEIVDNVKICQQTYDILKEIPNIKSVVFSVLGPGKYVKAHIGMYKGVYRGLLCLDVAKEGECWIKIEDRKIPFEVGKCVVFDETALHEVHNDTKQDRVVLYLDFYRPFKGPIAWYNLLIFTLLRNSSYIKTMLRAYHTLDDSVILDKKTRKRLV